jgi:chaperonin GroES
MLRPVEDKIVVKRESQEQKTTSGLVLAGSNEKSNEAIVVAVGPGIKLNDGSFIEPGVSPGDKVVFNQFNAKEILHDGEDYLIITIRDLLAVIE